MIILFFTSFHQSFNIIIIIYLQNVAYHIIFTFYVLKVVEAILILYSIVVILLQIM